MNNCSLAQVAVMTTCSYARKTHHTPHIQQDSKMSSKTHILEENVFNLLLETDARFYLINIWFDLSCAHTEVFNESR
eukprot:snap_masked-scaffold_13-processed-gene-6.43-mRNA-1 protein AED:1.00 eAED:1.00 QI:0/0/0/0/1/1/2/0/76